MIEIIEVIALFLGFSGWILIFISLQDQYWKESTTEGSVITTSTIYENLWMSCASDSTGIYNCRDFPSLFALPGKFVIVTVQDLRKVTFFCICCKKNSNVPISGYSINMRLEHYHICLQIVLLWSCFISQLTHFIISVRLRAICLWLWLLFFSLRNWIWAFHTYRQINEIINICNECSYCTQQEQLCTATQ